jgi:hypothetical protein
MPYKVKHPLKKTLEDIALNRLGENMLSPGITTEIKKHDDRIKTVETSITQTNEELALKASQSELNALGVRVEAAETAIILNSQQIELKASQESVNDLGERITAAETNIIQNANAIELKASKTDLDSLSERVTTAETSISQNASAITLKANQTSVDELENRLSIAETNITQNANAITLKADKTELTTTYAQDYEPAIPKIGDLWCDTSNNNELKRWNGTSWISLRDTSFVGGNVTYAQNTPPSSPNSGDIWIDTTGGKNIIKRWNGTAWIELRDGDIPGIISWKQGFQEITPDQIRTTVLEVYPNGVGQQSVIEQQADSISQRLIARNETGNPITNAEVELYMKSGETWYRIKAHHIEVIGDMIVDGAITANKLATGAVTTEKLAAGAVTADKIKAGTITADKISTQGLDASVIKTGTLTADRIQGGTLDVNVLGPNAITAAKLALGTWVTVEPNPTVLFYSYDSGNWYWHTNTSGNKQVEKTYRAEKGVTKLKVKFTLRGYGYARVFVDGVSKYQSASVDYIDQTMNVDTIVEVVPDMEHTVELRTYSQDYTYSWGISVRWIEFYTQFMLYNVAV